MQKHDEHYRSIEQTGDPEPIIIQESLMERLIEGGVPTRRAYAIVAGQKYISRLCTKNGEDWKKELSKAINYFTRGLTGDWVGEE